MRVGEDVIFVSIATERYLHMQHTGTGSMVIASFHQTLWNICPVSSGTVRARNLGFVFGNDVIRLYHGSDECLTIPDNWSDHPQHNMIVFEGGHVLNQARSLWRHELIKVSPPFPPPLRTLPQGWRGCSRSGTGRCWRGSSPSDCGT